MRARFCPSPTGTPHVGLIRTALFNWAFARKQGGTFIFRIEDTDAARDSEESYRQIIDGLSWLGIDWDEGVEVGGPHEPYRQSARGEIYREVVAKLLAGGQLYESYLTADEIEARNRAAGRAVQLGYDNSERELTSAQRAAYQAEGRQPALRLRVPDQEISFVDLVRGPITFPAGSFPDFVLVRPGGQPLYTLVNPLDDALMGVTHVLRGEDLLSSTPRQIALYNAMYQVGIAAHLPRFGHLPFVMGEGNAKLSKRNPESNLFLHRDRGFIPEGLLNYLALLGWSIAPDRDIFTLAELAANFEVSQVNPNPARFDQKKADAINAAHIRLLADDDLAQRLVPYLQSAGVLPAEPDLAQLQLLRAATPLIRERITVLSEAVGMLGFLFLPSDRIHFESEAVAALPANAAEILNAAVTALESLAEFNTSQIATALQAELIETMQLKPREAFAALRVAISGRRVSPPLFESMELLGKYETISRLSAFALGH